MADRRSLNDIPELPLRATGLAGGRPELVERYERGQHVTRAPFFGEQQMVFVVGPELNRYLLTTGRHQFSHGEGWGKIAFGDVPHLGTLDGETTTSSVGARRRRSRSSGWTATCR